MSAARTWTLETFYRSPAARRRLGKGALAWKAIFSLPDGTLAIGVGHTERVAVQRAAAEALTLEARPQPGVNVPPKKGV